MKRSLYPPLTIAAFVSVAGLLFASKESKTLSASEKADFVRLLGEADQDLQRWLVGGHPVPDEGYRKLVHRIIDRPQSSLPDS